MTTKKKFLSFVLAVVMMLSFANITSIAVFALDNIGTSEMITPRLNSVLEDQLDEMVANTIEIGGASQSLQIAYTMKISDFDGNQYTLAECFPTGYMIYHDASGVFVECSPVVNSPFFGETGTYKYAGPNEYYVIKRNFWI